MASHGKAGHSNDEDEAQPLVHRRVQALSDDIRHLHGANDSEGIEYGESGARSSHKPELPHRMWLLVLAFLDHFGVGLILPLFGPMLRDLGASQFEQGLLTSTYGFLQMISSPFIGRLSDHKGRTFVMTVSFVGAALGYTLIGTSQSVPAFFLSRVIVGVTKHSGNAQRAYVADHTSHSDRAVELGRLATAMGLGIMIGPIVGGVLFRIGRYAAPVWIGVGLQLMCAAFTNVYLPEKGQSNSGGESAADEFDFGKAESMTDSEGWGGVWTYVPRLTVLQRPKVPWLFAMRVVWGTASMAFQQGMTLLIVYKFKLGVEYNGLFLSYEGLLKAVARAFAVQPLVHLYQDGPLILRGLLVLCVSYFSSALSPTPLALCFLMAPVYVAAGVTGVTYISLLTTVVAPSEVGQVLGYYDMIMSACKVIGPTIAGALASIFDSSAPGIFSSILALVAAALFYVSGCSTPSVPFTQKYSPTPPPSSDIEKRPPKSSLYRFSSSADPSSGWELLSQKEEGSGRGDRDHEFQKEMQKMPGTSPAQNLQTLSGSKEGPVTIQIQRTPSPESRSAPGRSFSRVLATIHGGRDLEMERETKRSLASVFLDMSPPVPQKA